MPTYIAELGNSTRGTAGAVIVTQAPDAPTAAAQMRAALAALLEGTTIHDDGTTTIRAYLRTPARLRMDAYPSPDDERRAALAIQRMIAALNTARHAETDHDIKIADLRLTDETERAARLCRHANPDYPHLPPRYVTRY